MGISSSVNTNINVFSTSITQSLIQRVNASSTATCAVNIGSISFTENNGCAVTVSNMCSATATGVLDAVLEGIFQAYDQLDVSNKQDAAQIFSATFSVNTNVTTIKDDFSTYVEQECGASSNLNQNITIQNISLGKWTDPGNPPVVCECVNSGRADANCAIGVLQKLFVEATNKVAVENSQSSTIGFLVFGILGLAGIFAALVYFWYAKQILFTSVKDKIRLEWAKRDVLPWPLELDMYNQF
jgi:hypothetical protein